MSSSGTDSSERKIKVEFSSSENKVTDQPNKKSPSLVCSGEKPPAKSTCKEKCSSKKIERCHVDSTCTNSEVVGQIEQSPKDGTSPPSVNQMRRRRRSISASIIDALKKPNILSAKNENPDKVGKETDEWPDLYDLTWCMVDGSQMIYQLIMIRQMARDGKLPDSENALDTPITLNDALHLIDKHRESLVKYMGKKEANFFVETAENAKKRVASKLEREGLTLQDVETGKIHHEIIAVDDDNHTSELVYGIGVNSVTKRILLVFRGTATMTDVMTDLEFIKMRPMTNPLKSYEGQPENIYIHTGFHKYLYGMPKHSSSEMGVGKTQMMNKCDQLLLEIAEILDDLPDYTLYITGHSLGGALASLFSFSAACCNLPQFKKPIRCVSIASPKVGNEAFRKAFELLEEQNKIKYLRVVNDKDIIPMSPEQHIPITKPILRSCVYRHVGIQLKLYNDDRKVRVSYRRLKKGLSLAGQDLGITTKKYAFALTLCATCCYGAPQKHFCDVYAERVHMYKDILKKLQLLSLYELRLKDPGKEILFDAKKFR